MPNSQFETASLRPDGSVHVTGRVGAVEAGEATFRFMVVQDDVVVEGTGKQAGGQGWSGDADPGQGQLHAGPVLAIGLAIVAKKVPGRGLGYETLTWADQLDLKPE
jgi:hypothetical protein